MKIENAAAFNFIMQEDIYFLNSDRVNHQGNANMEVANMDPPLKTDKVAFDHLGGYKKKFLVMVYYPGLDFMAQQHLIPLESTLKRLGFLLDDVAIVNKATCPDVSLEQITAFFAPYKLLLLGKNAVPGNVEVLALNKIQRLNSSDVLLTFGFDEMMDSTENKKIFWEQMKLL